MERHSVIQGILDTFQAPTVYLEIGVSSGSTFHLIEASKKFAVDPKFAFDVDVARSQNKNSTYNQISSDDFFQGIGSNERFDLIFIDGLHTFEQTLRDLNNSVTCLRAGGVIVIDDVMPDSFASAISDLEIMQRYKNAMSITSGSWMGDVFKLVFYVADYFTTFSYATVADNHGQTILWPAPRAPYHSPALSIATISQLDFADAKIRSDVFQFTAFNTIRDQIIRSKAISAS